MYEYVIKMYKYVYLKIKDGKTWALYTRNKNQTLAPSIEDT